MHGRIQRLLGEECCEWCQNSAGLVWSRAKPDVLGSVFYFGDVFGSLFYFGDMLRSAFFIGDVYGLHKNRLLSLKH
jgi:hypothetical protein